MSKSTRHLDALVKGSMDSSTSPWLQGQGESYERLVRMAILKTGGGQRAVFLDALDDLWAATGLGQFLSRCLDWLNRLAKRLGL